MGFGTSRKCLLFESKIVWSTYFVLLLSIPMAPSYFVENIVESPLFPDVYILRLGAIRASFFHMGAQSFALLYHACVLLAAPVLIIRTCLDIRDRDFNSSDVVRFSKHVLRAVFGSVLAFGMAWYMADATAMHFYLVRWGGEDKVYFALLAHLGTGTAFSICAGLALSGIFAITKGRK